MRDQILRHQLLLMRLVKTQAKVTKYQLKEAERIILLAIQRNKLGGLRANLQVVLGAIPTEAIKLLNELALYETAFTVRVLKRELKKEVIKPDDAAVIKKVDVTLVAVALNKVNQTIKETYNTFASNKLKQYAQVLKDAKVIKEESEVTATKIKSLTSGLFTVQNLALAGVAVIAVANMSRAEVVLENGMSLQWAAELDNATCPFCEAQDGLIFTEEESASAIIPAHSNCRCTWIPV